MFLHSFIFSIFIKYKAVKSKSKSASGTSLLYVGKSLPNRPICYFSVMGYVLLLLTSRSITINLGSEGSGL